MNFYKRFVGDIQAKTGDLTLAEFGAYDRLLDHYYSTEQGLPPDVARCYAIARAMTKDERKAVEFVLSKFFTLGPDGLYTQGRTEAMIAEAQPKIDAARANGKKGGRPPKKTEPKPTGLISVTQDEPNAKASQSKSKNSLRSEPPHPPAGGAFDRFWKAWPKHPRKVASAQCLAKWKAKGCEEIAEQVIAAVQAAINSEGWRKNAGEFIPAPLVWLNQERWLAPLPAALAPSESAEQYLERRKREAEAEAAEKARSLDSTSTAARDLVLAKHGLRRAA